MGVDIKRYAVERDLKPTVYFTDKKDAVDYLLSLGYAYYEDMDGYYKPVEGSRGYYQARLWEVRV